MASPFVGKDGSRHTNKTSQVMADARFGAKQPKPKAGNGNVGGAQRNAAGADDASYGEPEEGQDGKAMAAEHGPATQLDIAHDHEAGRHTVHAVHPDGHEHETEHPSAEEAHAYAADCAGCGSGGMAGGGMGGE